MLPSFHFSFPYLQSSSSLQPLSISFSLEGEHSIPFYTGTLWYEKIRYKNPTNFVKYCGLNLLGIKVNDFTTYNNQHFYCTMMIKFRILNLKLQNIVNSNIILWMKFDLQRIYLKHQCRSLKSSTEELTNFIKLFYIYKCAFFLTKWCNTIHIRLCK